MNKRLYLILALAFALRAWGIWFGPYHPDEPLVINQVLSFGTGNPFPFVYYYPPFFHYILFISYGLFFIVGWIAGLFRNFDNFLFLVLVKQLPFYFIGRFLVALIGTATVIPVYLIVKRIRSENAALIAALFMSCMYVHVRNSHYCTVDVPMTFMVMLSYLYILRITQVNNTKDYVLAGILCGLAIATKYSALILVPCLLIAGFVNFSHRGHYAKNIRNIILSIACAAAISLIFCSYCIWDYPHFIQAVNVLRRVENMNISPWYRFRVNLYYGMGLPLEIFGILGLIYLIFKEKKRGAVLAAFPFLYFLILAKAGQPFSRYILPVVPFFAVGAGIFYYDSIAGLIAKIKFQKILSCAVIGLIIIYPLASSVYLDYLLSKPDIRDLAEDWVYKNIPLGSKIAVDNPQYAPHLFPTKEQLRQKAEYLPEGKGKNIKKRRLEMLDGLKGYPAQNYEIYYLGESAAEFSMHTPVIPHSRKDILGNDIKYIIASDFDIRDNKEFYKNLRKECVVVKEFSPFRSGNKVFYSNYPYSHTPVDNTLFTMSNNGVGIKIFKIIER